MLQYHPGGLTERRLEWMPSLEAVETITSLTMVVPECEEVSSIAVRKPTKPRLQPNTFTCIHQPSPVPATGCCGKAAPAEIQCIPVHRPAGAGPTLGISPGVALGEGLGGVWIVALGCGDDVGSADGGEETKATLHPATRHATASAAAGHLNHRLLALSQDTTVFIAPAPRFTAACHPGFVPGCWSVDEWEGPTVTWPRLFGSRGRCQNRVGGR